jgi:hypothetical protein
MTPSVRPSTSAPARALPSLRPSELRCRIEPYWIKAAPGGAAGPASAPGSGLGRPRPAHAGPHHTARRSKMAHVAWRRVQRKAVSLALDCPARNHSVKGGPWAFASHRPLTRRPLTWSVSETDGEHQSTASPPMAKTKSTQHGRRRTRDDEAQIRHD